MITMLLLLLSNGSFPLVSNPQQQRIFSDSKNFSEESELNNTVLCSSTLDVSIPVAFNFLKFLGVVLVFVKSVLLRYFYLHEPLIYAFLARVISLLLSLVR